MPPGHGGAGSLVPPLVLAPRVALAQHCCQGAATYSGQCSHLGSLLAWQVSVVIFGQHGGCSLLEQVLIKEPFADAPAPCIIFCRSSLQSAAEGEAYIGSNLAADNLSRDNLAEFFVSCPQADPLPCPLPTGLLPLLLNLRQSWPLANWCQQLSATFSSH